MPIYLLSRTESADYDEFESKIVRAKNVAEARNIANGNIGDEGRIWEDFVKVKCTRIAADGSSRELLASFNAG